MFAFEAELFIFGELQDKNVLDIIIRVNIIAEILINIFIGVFEAFLPFVCFVGGMLNFLRFRISKCYFFKLIASFAFSAMFSAVRP